MSHNDGNHDDYEARGGMLSDAAQMMKEGRETMDRAKQMLDRGEALMERFEKSWLFKLLSKLGL